eukprot:GFYU01003029.1.p2 GENE.GFYU01003029.1~~GFYU01003029.1.p2  ORF type:complete len:176 (+),score=58.59 GFYU01003029.1:90-617(+)
MALFSRAARTIATRVAAPAYHTAIAASRPAPFVAGVKSFSTTSFRQSNASINLISTDEAPAAIGPYSQACEANGTVYVSGALGLNPETMEFPSDDVEEQTEQTMKNLQAVVEASGSNMSRVLKTTVLLADMDDFPKVNAIYAKYFGEHRPARACFAVRTLPKGARVEIDAIALQE